MKREIWKGSEAIAEAAIRAGCRGFFGYPITPQNEIPEYMSLKMPQAGGVFVQAESEVAAINMVYGAAASGIRAMTSSSSPGVSLKQEGISYMVGAQLPAVIVNVMRGGPGLGSIQPAQGDYYQATRGGGNGDYRTVVIAPANLQETVDLMQEAFDIADQYRNPVIVLVDGLIGQMMEPIVWHDNPGRQLPEKTWAATGLQLPVHRRGLLRGAQPAAGEEVRGNGGQGVQVGGADAGGCGSGVRGLRNPLPYCANRSGEPAQAGDQGWSVPPHHPVAVPLRPAKGSGLSDICEGAGGCGDEHGPDAGRRESGGGGVEASAVLRPVRRCDSNRV